jgi:site-specific DNA-methyltransferase (adenine-specific)
VTLDYSIDTGDYLAIAPSIPSRSFDHVFKDSPYSNRTHDNYRQGGGDEKRRGVRQAVSTGRDLAYSALTPAHRRQWAYESARIARRWVLAFTDDAGIDGWKTDFEAAGLIYVRLLVWVRGAEDIDQETVTTAVRGRKGAPQFTGDRPAQGCEFMVLCHTADTPMRWNGRGARTDGTGGKTGGGSVYFADIASEERLCGADGKSIDGQKPLGLISELMRDLTNPGDSILDPFVGSGTLVRAAINEGRSARGIEINPGRAAAARARCKL